MDKLNKLEELINKFLEKAMKWLLAFAFKLIPRRLITLVNNLRSSFKNKVLSAKSSLIEKCILIKTKALSYLQKVKDSINKIQNLPYKTLIRSLLLRIKNFLLKTPLKGYVKIFSNWISPYYKRLEFHLERIAPSHYGIALAGLFMISSGVLGIYLTSNDILKKEFPYRAPASVQEYDYRPDYLQYKKKTIKIFNIKVPVYLEEVGEVKSVTVDFSLRTSTRFARYYLEQYEYKLKDYFFSSVQPVISSFPLEEEGKDVLKEAIIQEIDLFLKHENVEGVIDDVRILYVIGT